MLRCLVLMLLLLLTTACSSRDCKFPENTELNRVLFRCDLSENGDSIDAALEGCLAKRGHQNLDVLALSGGGQKGAFGAGFLNGWSQNGDRPEFDIVTGISTGALISTFAFLGPRYDPVLEQLYTSVTNAEILRSRGLIRGLFSSSLATLEPLEEIIESFITEEVIIQVAEEYQKGRRLLVGTVNLDDGNLVIWDLSALAHREREKAAHLYRQVLLASASIPVQFAPVFIDGEMHVDGGVREPIFAAGIVERLCRGAQKGEKIQDTSVPIANLYLVVNNKVGVDPLCVSEGLLSIGERSLDVLLSANMHGSLFRLYALALEYSLGYRLVHIADDTVVSGPDDPFDPEVMDRLFIEGRERWRLPDLWETNPPDAIEFR